MNEFKIYYFCRLCEVLVLYFDFDVDRNCIGLINSALRDVTFQLWGKYVCSILYDSDNDASSASIIMMLNNL